MSSTTSKHSEFHQELPPPYRAAVDAVLSEEVPRLTSTLASRLVPPRTVSSTVTVRNPRTRWLMQIASLACAAAAAILVACVIFMSPASAWAQIAKAVSEQPWIKMELALPEKQEKVEVWLSPTRRMASTRAPGSVLFMDLSENESRRYIESDGTVYISDTSVMDLAEYVWLDAVLGAFSNGHEPKQSSVTLLSQSIRTESVEDKRWKVYVLEYEDKLRLVPRISRSFFVPEGGKLPDKMTEEFKHDGKTISKVYQLSYPKEGPTDLVALGVPKDAKVIDTRSGDDLRTVLKLYATRQKTRPEAYTATVLRSSQNWKGLSEAYRVRFGDTGHSAEINDFEQLQKFQMDLFADMKTIPEGEEAVQWWMDQVGQMTFNGFGDSTYFTPGQIVCPDLVGYQGLGIPNEGEKATFNPKPFVGPSNTVLVAVEDAKTGAVIRRYWLAPERGYLCVRSEMADSKSGWIATIIVDTTEKSPTGYWYATQVRTGRVERSGDDLRADAGVAPVNTSVYRYLVEFTAADR